MDYLMLQSDASSDDYRYDNDVAELEGSIPSDFRGGAATPAVSGDEGNVSTLYDYGSPRSPLLYEEAPAAATLEDYLGIDVPGVDSSTASFRVSGLFDPEIAPYPVKPGEYSALQHSRTAASTGAKSNTLATPLKENEESSYAPFRDFGYGVSATRRASAKEPSAGHNVGPSEPKAADEDAFNFGMEAFLQADRLGFGRQPSFRRPTAHSQEVASARRTSYSVPYDDYRDAEDATPASVFRSHTTRRTPSRTVETKTRKRSDADGADPLLQWIEGLHGATPSEPAREYSFDAYSYLPRTPKRVGQERNTPSGGGASRTPSSVVERSDVRREIDDLVKNVLGGIDAAELTLARARPPPVHHGSRSKGPTGSGTVPTVANSVPAAAKIPVKQTVPGATAGRRQSAATDTPKAPTSTVTAAAALHTPAGRTPVSAIVPSNSTPSQKRRRHMWDVYMVKDELDGATASTSVPGGGATLAPPTVTPSAGAAVSQGDSDSTAVGGHRRGPNATGGGTHSRVPRPSRTSSSGVVAYPYADEAWLQSSAEWKRSATAAVRAESTANGEARRVGGGGDAASQHTTPASSSAPPPAAVLMPKGAAPGASSPKTLPPPSAPPQQHPSVATRSPKPSPTPPGEGGERGVTKTASVSKGSKEGTPATVAGPLPSPPPLTVPPPTPAATPPPTTTTTPRVTPALPAQGSPKSSSPPVRLPHPPTSHHAAPAPPKSMVSPKQSVSLLPKSGIADLLLSLEYRSPEGMMDSGLYGGAGGMAYYPHTRSPGGGQRDSVEGTSKKSPAATPTPSAARDSTTRKEDAGKQTSPIPAPPTAATRTPASAAAGTPLPTAAAKPSGSPKTPPTVQPARNSTAPSAVVRPSAAPPNATGRRAQQVVNLTSIVPPTPSAVAAASPAVSGAAADRTGGSPLGRTQGATGATHAPPASKSPTTRESLGAPPKEVTRVSAPVSLVRTSAGRQPSPEQLAWMAEEARRDEERQKAIQRANEERRERVRAHLEMRKAQKQQEELRRRQQLQHAKAMAQEAESRESVTSLPGVEASAGSGTSAVRMSKRARRNSLIARDKRRQSQPSAPYIPEADTVLTPTMRGPDSRDDSGTLPLSSSRRGEAHVRPVVVLVGSSARSGVTSALPGTGHSGTAQSKEDAAAALRRSVEFTLKDRSTLEVRHDPEQARFFNVHEYIEYVDEPNRRLSSVTLCEARQKFLGGMNVAVLAAATKSAQQATFAALRDLTDGICRHLPPDSELYASMAMVRGGQTEDLLGGDGRTERTLYTASPFFGITLEAVSYVEVTGLPQFTKMITDGYKQSKLTERSTSGLLILSVILKQIRDTDVVLSAMLFADAGPNPSSYNEVLQKDALAPFPLFSGALGGPTFTVAAFAVNDSDHGTIQLLNTQHKLYSVMNKPPHAGSVRRFIELATNELKNRKPTEVGRYRRLREQVALGEEILRNPKAYRPKPSPEELQQRRTPRTTTTAAGSSGSTAGASPPVTSVKPVISLSRPAAASSPSPLTHPNFAASAPAAGSDKTGSPSSKVAAPPPSVPAVSTSGSPTPKTRPAANATGGAAARRPHLPAVAASVPPASAPPKVMATASSTGTSLPPMVPTSSSGKATPAVPAAEVVERRTTKRVATGTPDAQSGRTPGPQPPTGVVAATPPRNLVKAPLPATVANKASGGSSTTPTSRPPSIPPLAPEPASNGATAASKSPSSKSPAPLTPKRATGANSPATNGFATHDTVRLSTVGDDSSLSRKGSGEGSGYINRGRPNGRNLPGFMHLEESPSSSPPRAAASGGAGARAGAVRRSMDSATAAAPSNRATSTGSVPPPAALEPEGNVLPARRNSVTGSKRGSMTNRRSSGEQPGSHRILPGSTAIGADGPMWPSIPTLQPADIITVCSVGDDDSTTISNSALAVRDRFGSGANRGGSSRNGSRVSVDADSMDAVMAPPAATKVRTLVIVDPRCSETSNVTYDNTLVIATLEDDFEEYDVDEVTEMSNDSAAIHSDVLKELCNTVLMGCNGAILGADSRSSSATPLVLKSVVHAIFSEFQSQPNRRRGSLSASFVKLNHQDALDLLDENSTPQKVVIAISPLFGGCVNGVKSANVDSPMAFDDMLNSALQRASAGGRDYGLVFCTLILKQKLEEENDVLVCSLSASFVAAEQVGVYNAVLDRSPLMPRALFHYALGGPCYTVALLGIGSDETKANQMLKVQARLGEVSNRTTLPGSIARFITGITTDLGVSLKKQLQDCKTDEERGKIREIVNRVEEMMQDAEALLHDFDNHDPKAYLSAGATENAASGDGQDASASPSVAPSAASGTNGNSSAGGGAPAARGRVLPDVVVAEDDEVEEGKETDREHCIQSLVCFDQPLLGGGSVAVQGNTLLVRTDDGGMQFDCDEVVLAHSQEPALHSVLIDRLLDLLLSGYNTGLLAADSDNCAFTPFMLRKIAYSLLYAMSGGDSMAQSRSRHSFYASGTTSPVTGDLQLSMALIKDGITADLLPLEEDGAQYRFEMEHSPLYGPHIVGVASHVVAEPKTFDHLLGLAIENAEPSINSDDPGIMVILLTLTQRVHGGPATRGEDVLVSSMICTAVFDAVQHYVNVLQGDPNEPLDLFRTILNGPAHSVAMFGISDVDRNPGAMLDVLSRLTHRSVVAGQPNSIKGYVASLQQVILQLRERLTTTSKKDEREYIMERVVGAERALHEAEAHLAAALSQPRQTFVPLGATADGAF